MRQFTISILVFCACFTTYGQVKVNPNGKFFNYNGTNIYYEDTGTGEPLLLLHNFFNTADCWKPYVEVYSKQYRTIAVDMIGHGRSDIYKKDDLHFRHEDYAKMIFALLDSLKLNNLNAIGASSGGMTLLYLNCIQPDRFKTVITIGAQIYYSKQCREWVTKTGLNEFMEWAKYHGPEKQEYLARVFWEFRKFYGDPSFTPDILGTIRAKWLVVQGDNDEPVPLQNAIEMHQYIPNNQLWIVPDGGHLPHLIPAFQPEFLRVSLEFLNGKWDGKD
ncbi:alpha/beta hydrolase [Agriterribacter sp.]|uniref:alpha/beta fold hydrolase n=1 Tax=Agriterribacter sp. TaxID=2821509 RepID=UPI002C23EAD9|nr:alpha/beta hydrolase [Agriterribacter sp.]HRO45497.1 alpha/beta hydrolase [Agriterribacter sp.]HRQ19048.1 alpha/beta hydrolase [Agriterribacter sp.]